MAQCVDYRNHLYRLDSSASTLLVLPRRHWLLAHAFAIADYRVPRYDRATPHADGSFLVPQSSDFLLHRPSALRATMPPTLTAEPGARRARAEFYDRCALQGLAPLWEVAVCVGNTSATDTAQPAKWSFLAIRPLLMERVI